MLRINRLGEFETSSGMVETASYRGDTQVKSEASLNKDQIDRVVADAPALAEKMIREAQLAQEQRIEERNLNAYRERVMNEAQVKRSIMREARNNHPATYAKALEQMTWQPNDIQTMSDLNYFGTKYFAGPKLIPRMRRPGGSQLNGAHFSPSKDFETVKFDVDYGNGQQGEVVLLPNMNTPVARETYIPEDQKAEAIAGYMGSIFDDLWASAQSGIQSGLTEGAQDRLEDEAYKLLNPDKPAPAPVTQTVVRTVPGSTTMTTVMSPANKQMLMISAGVLGLGLIAILALKRRA